MAFQTQLGPTWLQSNLESPNKTVSEANSTFPNSFVFFTAAWTRLSIKPLLDPKISSGITKINAINNINEKQRTYIDQHALYKASRLEIYIVAPEILCSQTPVANG